MLMAVPLLLLGSGAENLFWAFQTGFVGSVMFGVWALVFIERPADRHAPVVASVLLVAALASSGMGLFFLVATAARADPRSLATVASRWRSCRRPRSTSCGSCCSVRRGGRYGSGCRESISGAVRSPGYRLLDGDGSRASDHLPEGYLWGLLLFIGLSAVAGYRVVRGRRATPLAIRVPAGNRFDVHAHRIRPFGSRVRLRERQPLCLRRGLLSRPRRGGLAPATRRVVAYRGRAPALLWRLHSGVASRWRSLPTSTPWPISARTFSTRRTSRALSSRWLLTTETRRGWTRRQGWE